MKGQAKVTEPGCIVCGSDNLGRLICMPAVPVHCGIYYKTREEARRAPKAKLDLHVCRHCGHIQNTAFNPTLLRYGPEYENALTCSPVFRRYLHSLAKRLVCTYGLRGKEIVEIGCGQGEFLKLLCRLGRNRGLGIDPGYRQTTRRPASKAVRFTQDRFNPSRKYLRANGLICFRHLLEHVGRPLEFLTAIRAGLGSAGEAVVYCEVPNAEPMLRAHGLWDIIYEHCSYFTRNSLRAVFTQAGFRVLSLGSSFDGQFLCCEAVPGEWVKKRKRDSAYPRGLRVFARAGGQYLMRVRKELKRRKRNGERIGIWGAGSKGVMLANHLHPGLVECLVDINPRKHAKYIACSGDPVLAPSDLTKMKLNRILVTNPVYINEIARYLTQAKSPCALEQI